MTKTEKIGALICALLEVPLLYLCAAITFSFSEYIALFFSAAIGSFILLNWVAVKLFIDKANKRPLVLFLRYCLISFISTLIILVIILLAMIGTGGFMGYKKIGG